MRQLDWRDEAIQVVIAIAYEAKEIALVTDHILRTSELMHYDNHETIHRDQAQVNKWRIIDRHVLPESQGNLNNSLISQPQDVLNKGLIT